MIEGIVVSYLIMGIYLATVGWTIRVNKFDRLIRFLIILGWLPFFMFIMFYNALSSKGLMSDIEWEIK